MKQNVIERLNSIRPLSQDLQNHFSAILKFKSLKRNEILVTAGVVNEFVYFIDKGILRSHYVNTDNTEVSIRFIQKGDFVASISKFLDKPISHETVQALEPCELYYITYAQLDEIYEIFPEYNFHGRKILERYFESVLWRFYTLLLPKGNERYNFLMQRDPELIQRIPLKHLASYLRIKPSSLSRIRKDRKTGN